MFGMKRQLEMIHFINRCALFQFFSFLLEFFSNTSLEKLTAKSRLPRELHQQRRYGTIGKG